MFAHVRGQDLAHQDLARLSGHGHINDSLQSEARVLTEMEKYEAGLPSFLDPEVAKMKENALRLCRAFNELDTADLPAQTLIIRELFGTCGERLFMQPPFNYDVGANISLGEDFLFQLQRENSRCWHSPHRGLLHDRSQHRDLHREPSALRQ